jgi:hypothetical protein
MSKHRDKTSVVAYDVSFPLLRKAVVDETAAGQRYDAAVMSRVLRTTGWDRPREESGQAAWEALVAVQEALMGYAMAVAQELPSAEWLWYLRRVEPLFRRINSMASTAPYTAAIAESVSAMSATAARPSVDYGPFKAFRLTGLRPSRLCGCWRSLFAYTKFTQDFAGRARTL